MGFRAFSVVAKKEILDNARDRRAMMTALLMPLLGPITLIAIFGAMQQAEQKTKAPHVPIIGRENAPVLVEYLEHNGVIVDKPPGDVEQTKQAVREQKVDVALSIPADFGEHLRAGTPAVVEVICDPSRQQAAPTLERVDTLINGYGRQIGALRLLVRGVDPTILEAVRAQRVVVSTPEATKALFLASFPLFMCMACFASALYISIDITAGERERGSLEPLLLNPVSTFELVAAKTAAAFVFGLMGISLAIGAFAVVMPTIPFEEVGIDLHLPPKIIAGYLLLFLPTTLLSTALQIFIGTLSKNTKTAQATLGLFLMLPVLSGMVLSIFPQQPSLFLCAIPTVGENIIAMRLLRNEPVEVVHWLLNSGVDVVVALACSFATTRLFGQRMLPS